MKEVWKPVMIAHTLQVDGTPRYEVSDMGNVRLADEWSDFYHCQLRKHFMWGEFVVWLNNGSGKGVGRIHKISELQELAFGKKNHAAKALVAPVRKRTVAQGANAVRRPVVVEQSKTATESFRPAMERPKPVMGVTKPVAEETKPVPVVAKPVVERPKPVFNPPKTTIWKEPPKQIVPEPPVQNSEPVGGRLSETAQTISQKKDTPERVRRTAKRELIGDGRPGKRKAVRQLDMSGKLIRVYPSGAAAALASGVPQSSVSACCRGRVNSAGGYRWEFDKE